MLDKSQDILRLSIAAAALLIGGSVAYHYAIYIPEKDQEAKTEAVAKEAADERRDQEKTKAAEKTAEEKRTAYKICVSNALENYNSRWQASCRSKAQQAANNRSDCLTRGLDANYCASVYPTLPSKDCELPNALADDYDQELKDEKGRCLQEASSGLESAL